MDYYDQTIVSDGRIGFHRLLAIARAQLAFHYEVLCPILEEL